MQAAEQLAMCSLAQLLDSSVFCAILCVPLPAELVGRTSTAGAALTQRVAAVQRLLVGNTFSSNGDEGVLLLNCMHHQPVMQLTGLLAAHMAAFLAIVVAWLALCGASLWLIGTPRMGLLAMTASLPSRHSFCYLFAVPPAPGAVSYRPCYCMPCVHRLLSACTAPARRLTQGIRSAWFAACSFVDLARMHRFCWMRSPRGVC